MSENGRHRPIDDHPRVKAIGLFILYSGVIPLLGSVWFISRAWRSIEPGLSALMATLLGMSFLIVWQINHEDTND